MRSLRGRMQADVARELILAARGLRRRPGLAAAAVLTLGLGIGATTAVFTVVDAVLLRPLPFAEPERLVRIWSANPSRGLLRFGVSPLDFLDFRSQTRSFATVAAWSMESATLVGESGAERLSAAWVTEGFLDMLGVPPQIGRGFGTGDFRAASDTVVISDDVWRRRFASDPAIVGRTIRVDGRALSVVGVMPRGFRAPAAFDRCDLWRPWRFRDDDLRSRGARWLGVLARLRPGIDLASARNEMAALAARLQAAYPDKNTGWEARLVPLAEAVTGQSRVSLLALLGAVSLLLLVACLNVAGLLAARAYDRRLELGVRSALGASQRQLLAPLLAEGVLLALAGGGLGLLVARWGRDGLLWLARGELPQLNAPTLDGRIAGGALLAALAAGLLCALLPALPIVRGATPEVRRGATGGRGAARFRQSVVVAQIAVTVTLLAGAGLMARTLAKLFAEDAGIDTNGVLTFHLGLPNDAYPDATRRAAFYDSALAALRQVPGAAAVGATTVLPLSGDDWSLSFDRLDRPKPESEQDSSAYRIVTPQLFAALGVPVRRGRSFTAGDRAGMPLVAAVNETFARRFFAGEDPLGKQIRIGDRTLTPRTIVAVVGDVREDLAQPPPPMMFVPVAQKPQEEMTFVLRLVPRAAEGTAMAAARAAISRLDRNLPLWGFARMDDVRRESVGRRRLSGVLLTAFASAALGLAMIGLYGVTAFGVSRRVREFGVRMAVGASQGAILRLVLGGALRLAVWGVGIGLGGALVAGRALSALLYGVRADDPWTLAMVALLALGAALVGTWLPARQATAQDALTALRSE